MKIDTEREFGQTGEVTEEYANVHDGPDYYGGNEDTAKNLSKLKEDPKVAELFHLLKYEYGAFVDDESIMSAIKTGQVYVDGNDAIRILNTGVAIVGRVGRETLEKLIHELNHPGCTSCLPTHVPVTVEESRTRDAMEAIRDPKTFAADVQNPRQRGEKRALSGILPPVHDTETAAAMQETGVKGVAEPKPTSTRVPSTDPKVTSESKADDQSPRSKSAKNET